MADKNTPQLRRISDIINARSILPPVLDIKAMVGKEFVILNYEHKSGQNANGYLQVWARGTHDNAEFSFTTSNKVLVAQIEAVGQIEEPLLCRLEPYGKGYQLV